MTSATSTPSLPPSWLALPPEAKLRLLERLRQTPAPLPDLTRYADDPLGFKALLWPDVSFYDRQEELLRLCVLADELVVVAGNQLGKDYVFAFCALWGFLCHREARVVTTSVRDDHLRILFGEIERFVRTSRLPLTADRGGPLVVNHRDVRKIVGGRVCPISYLRGMVSERPEGLAGHHAEFSMFMADEASGVSDDAFDQARTWAKKRVAFGNPNDCDNHFRRAAEGGELRSADGRRLYRAVRKISALDSPNVRRGLARLRGEPEPAWPAAVPGVLSYEEYEARLATWDVVRRTVGLDAEFYEGREVRLFPPDWLSRAAAVADRLRGVRRQAKAVGCDPGEGGADTSMAAVDEFGLIDLVSVKTPDTSAVTSLLLAFVRKHNVPADRVCIDRGGGGKQHADRLRAQGHAVRTVAFGEAIAPEPRRGQATYADRVDAREERYACVNMRAFLYAGLRDLLDPAVTPRGFGIPAEYAELRRQLVPIPLTYDGEGRLYLLPKSKRDPRSKQKTLQELIGRSPDDADAVCLAVHAMFYTQKRNVAGAIA